MSCLFANFLCPYSRRPRAVVNALGEAPRDSTPIQLGPLIPPADDQAWANPGKGIVRVTVAALILKILYPSIGCWVKLWF
jgi:hypothetical protein